MMKLLWGRPPPGVLGPEKGGGASIDHSGAAWGPGLPLILITRLHVPCSVLWM
jgi:hypothetical protein